jgi:hypothetical protein
MGRKRLGELTMKKQSKMKEFKGLIRDIIVKATENGLRLKTKIVKSKKVYNRKKRGHDEM